MGTDSNGGHCIRRKKQPIEALANEMDTSDEQCEERPVKGQKMVYQPTKEEWDDHMRTYGVFREWCPFCVRGKCKSGAHMRTEKSEEELEQEVLDIQLTTWIRNRGKTGPKSGEDRAMKVMSLPILVGLDREKKSYFAHMVPKKGHDAHAIKIMAREVSISGYPQLILKSDQEPAIRGPTAAVRRERPVGVEIMIEESPVGEHQSNGEAERAIQSVQEMMRTTKLALQPRYKSRIRSDHPILPWLAKHAAMILNLCKVGKDGRTAYERRKGKRFLRTLPEFGECVRYLKPQSVGKEKLESRWESGVFAGPREESGEICVMSDQGVIKVRGYLRKPEEERWNQEEFAGAQGVPWEPVPGRNHIDIKAKFTIPSEIEEEEVIVKEPAAREMIPTRIYIKRSDVSEKAYGMTPGCRGCEAANRGLLGVHNERCRERIEKEIKEKDPDRCNKVLERLVQREMAKDKGGDEKMKSGEAEVKDDPAREDDAPKRRRTQLPEEAVREEGGMDETTSRKEEIDDPTNRGREMSEPMSKTGTEKRQREEMEELERKERRREERRERKKREMERQEESASKVMRNAGESKGDYEKCEHRRGIQKCRRKNGRLSGRSGMDGYARRHRRAQDPSNQDEGKQRCKNGTSL